MRQNNRKHFYTAIIERAKSGFGAFFPGVPGCASHGDTIQGAAVNAEEALQGRLTPALESGETFPAVTPIDDISGDPDVDEAARVLVRFDPPGRSTRVNAS
jgi:predicted RNase H-like HicB family nuclease